MGPELPVVTARKVVATLQRAGFYVHHQVGSHAQLKHPDRPDLRVTVPIHARDLPRPVLKNILRQAELSVDQFIKLL